jgi:AcrR family transcriptional regulator
VHDHVTRPDGGRRRDRTRRALRAALVDLLRTRDFDELTVQDLLAEADVGRSTFYSHFTGKADLLRYGMQSLGQEVRLAAEQTAAGADFAFVRPLLEHIAGHRELFRHLKGRGGEIHRQALGQLLTDLSRQAMGGGSDARFDPVRELRVQFAKGALQAVILWWIERNSSLAPAEVEAEFRRLLREGLADAGAA